MKFLSLLLSIECQSLISFLSFTVEHLQVFLFHPFDSFSFFLLFFYSSKFSLSSFFLCFSFDSASLLFFWFLFVKEAISLFLFRFLLCVFYWENFELIFLKVLFLRINCFSLNLVNFYDYYVRSNMINNVILKIFKSLNLATPRIL